MLFGSAFDRCISLLQRVSYLLCSLDDTDAYSFPGTSSPTASSCCGQSSHAPRDDNSNLSFKAGMEDPVDAGIIDPAIIEDEPDSSGLPLSIVSWRLIVPQDDGPHSKGLYLEGSSAGGTSPAVLVPLSKDEMSSASIWLPSVDPSSGTPFRGEGGAVGRDGAVVSCTVVIGGGEDGIPVALVQAVARAISAALSSAVATAWYRLPVADQAPPSLSSSSGIAADLTAVVDTATVDTIVLAVIALVLDAVTTGEGIALPVITTLTASAPAVAVVLALPSSSVLVLVTPRLVPPSLSTGRAPSVVTPYEDIPAAAAAAAAAALSAVASACFAARAAFSATAKALAARSAATIARFAAAGRVTWSWGFSCCPSPAGAALFACSEYRDLNRRVPEMDPSEEDEGFPWEINCMGVICGPTVAEGGVVTSWSVGGWRIHEG